MVVEGGERKPHVPGSPSESAGCEVLGVAGANPVNHQPSLITI